MPANIYNYEQEKIVNQIKIAALYLNDLILLAANKQIPVSLEVQRQAGCSLLKPELNAA